MKLADQIPNRRRARSERGVALIMVLLMAGIAFLMVASVLMSSATTARLSMRSMAHSGAVAASDAGLEVALALMRQDLQAQGAAAVAAKVGSDAYLSDIEMVLTQHVAGITALSTSIQSLATTNVGETLYEVAVQAETADPVPGRARVSLNLRMIDLPVTAFSYFYDIDLEHYAWHNWVVTGPVYCGSTNYFRTTSDATLTFAEKVFSVGPIRFVAHPMEPDKRASGPVQFLADRFEQVPSMVPLGPAGATNRMHWILEEPAVSDYGTPTGDQRFVNKADVVVRMDDAGVSISRGRRHGNIFVSDVLPACLRTNIYFYDGREAPRWAGGMGLDAAGVRDWVGSVLGGSPPAHPVVYITDQRTFGADFFTVRVENGETLGAGGFTLATPNPLYVKGHFNRVNPQPAMLAGDAITVLSDAWQDSNSNDILANRLAVDTTMNAAILVGIVPANGTYGSGWVANVLRLLEHWGGRTLSFSGSTAVLFESEEAVGEFYHGTYYYRPELRTFAFVDYFSGVSLADVPTVKMAVRSDYRLLAPL